jgi:hypothetical protein
VLPRTLLGQYVGSLSQDFIPEIGIPLLLSVLDQCSIIVSPYQVELHRNPWQLLMAAYSGCENHKFETAQDYTKQSVGSHTMAAGNASSPPTIIANARVEQAR